MTKHGNTVMNNSDVYSIQSKLSIRSALDFSGVLQFDKISHHLSTIREVESNSTQ
jgi:hypothetical protein